MYPCCLKPVWINSHDTSEAQKRLSKIWILTVRTLFDSVVVRQIIARSLYIYSIPFLLLWNLWLPCVMSRKDIAFLLPLQFITKLTETAPLGGNFSCFLNIFGTCEYIHWHWTELVSSNKMWWGGSMSERRCRPKCGAFAEETTRKAPWPRNAPIHRGKEPGSKNICIIR